MMATTVAEIGVKATGVDETLGALERVQTAANDAADALERVQSPRVEILSEPLTYQARFIRDSRDATGFRAISVNGNRSYVKDLALAETLRGDYVGARERLDRHAREMKAVGERRQAVFAPEATYEFESRAVNWASGTGGYSAPPLWITEQLATVPTPEKVLARYAPTFDLPAGAQSVNLPRWTAGADVDVQQLGGPAKTSDVTDDAVSSAVATIAGNADVPLQMLEQSPVGAHLDWAVFSNMEARYGYKLELQLIKGTGAASPQGSGNGQLLGFMNNGDVPAGNKLVYDEGTPTATHMISGTSGQNSLAQVIAVIGNTRLLPPEMWMMRTSRASWLVSSVVDFPLALADQTAPGRFDLLAYPVHQNDAIPATLSATANQDIVVALRPSDWLILEGERRTSVYTEVLSGSLMARLQMRRYVAALLRLPSSVSWLSGTGLVVQTGF